VETAWHFIDVIEESWHSGQPPLQTYAAGTWGPLAADMLLALDGRVWHHP
jgi:glucose-6-phosphate 1-dehydrogenase